MSDSAATQLLVLAAVEVYSLDGAGRHLITRGDLQVLSLDTRDLYGVEQTIVFLNMQGFCCPLVKQVPSLKVENAQYVFPIPPGRFYGVVLSSDTAPDIIDAFETLLDECTIFRVRGSVQTQPETEPQSVSAEASSSLQAEDQSAAQKRWQKVLTSGGFKLAAGLEKGSKKFSDVVVLASEVLGAGIIKGGDMVKSRISPNAVPTQITPEFKANLARTRQATGAAVTVSAGLVAGLKAMTTTIAGSLADTIADTETGRKFFRPQGSSSGSDCARELARSSLFALGEVLNGLETAGKIVAKSTAQATTSVIGHKYGADAELAANEALQSVGNVGAVTMSLNVFKPRSFATAAVGATAAQLIAGAPPSNPAIPAPSSSSSSSSLIDGVDAYGSLPNYPVLSAAPSLCPYSSSPAALPVPQLEAGRTPVTVAQDI